MKEIKHSLGKQVRELVTSGTSIYFMYGKVKTEYSIMTRLLQTVWKRLKNALDESG